MTAGAAGADGSAAPRAVRAAVLTAPGTFEMREFPLPAVGPDTGIVAVELCGICGTDLKYASGAVAAPLPMILGHEVVGRIESIGGDAADRWGVAPGDRVLIESSIPCWSCPQCRSGAYRLCPTKGGYGTRRSTEVPPGLWGGLAERMWLAAGSIVHRLPGSLDVRAALAIPLLGNGIQWLVRKGGLEPGDRVLIQGCGPQGLAAALVALAAGAAEVVVTGLRSDDARLAFASRIGARPVIVDPDWDAAARLDAVGRDYPIALDVSGSPAAVAGAPAHLAPGGTLVLAGLVGRDRTVPLATDELVWREIRIQAVLSKDESAIRAARDLVLSDPAIAAHGAALTTHVFPLAAVGEAIGALRSGMPGFVKAAVDPRATDPAGSDPA